MRPRKEVLLRLLDPVPCGDVDLYLNVLLFIIIIIYI